jgi:hypothetical protein
LKLPYVKNRDPKGIALSVRGYFGPVPGALKEHLNTVELSRITVIALTAGGGTLALLEALLMNVGSIFPAPTDAALAAVILTFLLESLRRLGHGQDHAPAGALGMRNPGGNGDGSAPFGRRS